MLLTATSMYGREAREYKSHILWSINYAAPNGQGNTCNHHDTEKKHYKCVLPLTGDECPNMT